MSHDSLSDRRSFLKGKAALEVIRGRLDDPENENKFAAPPGRSETYLEQYSCSAMGCQFQLSMNMHQYSHAGVAAMSAFELINQLETQLSIFRPESEVSIINGDAGAAPVQIESRLFELLKLAVDIHEMTNGAFDITTGSLSKLWGFESRQGELPTSERIDVALGDSGSKHLSLDDCRSTIRFENPKMKINLGGIGKGYALDRVVEMLHSMELTDFIVHGGQSSVFASGDSIDATASEPKLEHAGPRIGWQIGVTHPLRPGVRLGEVRLAGKALGTSGTARQGFFHDGKRYGHIINPRTGWPASHFLSTTVIADSCASADAIATALFVMSLDEVEVFCEENRSVSAIIVRQEKPPSPQIQILAFNLADDDWMPL